MRILLVLLFIAPMVPLAALLLGAEMVTPYLVGILAIGIAAYFFAKRRDRA